jgi:hypothetical protein
MVDAATATRLHLRLNPNAHVSIDFRSDRHLLHGPPGPIGLHSLKILLAPVQLALVLRRNAEV